MKIKQIIKAVSLLSFSVLLTFSNNGLLLSASSNPFDFSRDGSIDTITIESADFVEQILGNEITQLEKDYLKENGYDLKYEGKLSSSLVSTSFVEQELTVHAESHSYIDQSNNSIMWVPYQAKIDGKEMLFVKDDEKYVCVFDDVTSENLTITYKTVLNLDFQEVNRLINAPYYTAKYYVDNNVLQKEQEAYEQEYEQYLKDVKAYENYKEAIKVYYSDKEKYDAYLEEKLKYDEKLENYNEYLLEVEKYEQEVVLYNNYLKEVEEYDNKVVEYQNYLLELKKYNDKYAEYLKQYEVYKPKKEKVDYQLKAMDLIITEMTSMQRSVYNAVMGGTVTEVLARKDELVQLNADASVINDAENATYALRDIFSNYFSLTEESAKYAYYKSNYSSIKGNIEKLLRSLEKLYRSGLVSTAIEMFEKTDQYLILIAQLAVIANALDDKPVYNYEGSKNPSNKNADIFDSSWTIENKTIMKILENDVDFTDIDGYSYPLLEGYPKAPVEPEKIKVVEEPKAPVEVKKPVAPSKVEHPGNAPEEVKKPIKPSFVFEPEEPKPYVPDKNKTELVNAYNNGELVERILYSSDLEFTLYSSFTKNTNSLDVVSVEFYDENNNFIGKYTTDYESYIVFEHKIPNKEADEKYSEYAFSHWEYEDGEVLDLNCVTREGFVYPVYVGKTLQKYDVTWIVDSQTYVETYNYGDTPIFKNEITKSPEGLYYYEFTSWDNDIVEVVSNQQYIAQFERKCILNEHIDFINGTKALTLQINDLSITSIDVEKLFELYVHEGNEKKIVISSETYILEFPSSVVNSLKKAQIKKIDLHFDKENEFEHYYQIKLFNINNEQLNSKYEIKAKFLGSFSNKSTLYKITSEGEEEHRSTVNNNMISFTMTCNDKYHIYALNKITVSTIDLIDVSVSKQEAKYQEKIDLQIKENIQGIILEVHIVDALGNSIELEDGSFVMPNSNVYIIISYEYIYYKISFKVDDEIISTEEYKYGDVVVVPHEPKKSSDGQYNYIFVGWDKEISSVTQDAVYVAVFEKQEIEKPDNPTGGIGIIKSLKIGGIALGIAAVLTIVVTLVVKSRKSQKKKNQGKKKIAIKFE